MSTLPIQFIWDYTQMENCVKIPEKTISLEDIRKSCGIETDPNTGLRYYFVPQPKKIEDSSTDEVDENE